MQTRRTVHLVCGPIAAGKSTHARRLAAQTGAVRFAIDEWMATLFAADRPAAIDMAWATERVARCQTLIWSTCMQVLHAGADVVLEIGLLRAHEREQARARVDAAGHAASLHFVDAPRSIRLDRLARRNAERGATWSFEVTPAMFEAIEARFEPPTERERGDAALVLHGAGA